MAETAAHFEIVDPSFANLIKPQAQLEPLFDQCIWSEGPVWFADGNYLLWSDIPNNRMLQYVPDLGVSIFRAPSNFINGNTRDLSGRLISCSHGGRALLRTEPDGTITTLADSYRGGRLNSPNDVVVKSDGTIWFTDPPYGILSNHEGYQANSEQDACYVFRLDPADGSLTVVADDFAKPNGLAFSPDETTLYISDTGRSHDPDWPSHIRKFDVTGANTLTNPALFTDIDVGLADGFRLDREGNVWTSTGQGINVYSPSATLLGRIITGKKTSNLAFGGPTRQRLFITASEMVYALEIKAIGLQTP
ncbi:SMP-30/gluconolactonase/LRE family protein [Devosia rhodophyticola]|uniref:SMP-30/gluconolactonase/LRE family protein n=1 Tax=Devosia rhodophyticola TaxID=3026423 RepID=A0ABY7Z2U8_9HYPH|nr:SMP-30/gluconolactonase/LRE family protein [Devosia rhodophyticola]WDR07525.1 SMP-30/gluconolactonase/LRE family protein [Devosia rhodophyticola]